MEGLLFALGLILGGVLVGSAIILATVSTPIEECREKHNVHRCELIAVPVGEAK